MDSVAIKHYFEVSFEGFIPLGRWTKIDGLGVDFNPVVVKEGGENDIVTHLPGRLTFSNVTLTRPVDETSGMIASFLTSFIGMAASAVSGDLASILTIEAVDPDGDTVATWVLDGVTPVSYKGPSFFVNLTSIDVAVEQLVLAHNGFLEVGAGMGALL